MNTIPSAGTIMVHPALLQGKLVVCTMTTLYLNAKLPWLHAKPSAKTTCGTRSTTLQILPEQALVAALTHIAVRAFLPLH